MKIFSKKKTANSQKEIKENLHDIKQTMKKSLDWQESKKEEVNNIINTSDKIEKNIDELKQILFKQTEYFQN